jgi:PTH1 family peptidyl-tRNA hydrolase
MFIVVGLGNPGPEYENTRHNTGRIVLDAFRRAKGLPEWTFDKKKNTLLSEGTISSLKACPVVRNSDFSTTGVKSKKSKVLLLAPETFMNKSGDAIRQIKELRFKIKGKTKEIPNFVVIHDDLDIPFGSYKISFNKSSGGHRGVGSVVRTLRTQAFTRVRVGIAAGVSAIRKPQNEKSVEKTILGRFTESEMAALKKLAKEISEGLVVLITEGREKAMSQYHG